MPGELIEQLEANLDSMLAGVAVTATFPVYVPVFGANVTITQIPNTGPTSASLQEQKRMP
jgi:hypothetical protein